MNTPHFDIVHDDPNGHRSTGLHRALVDAIDNAMHAGFRIGRQVRIGRVQGSVVGYNIGGFGRFSGKVYPLLIETEFGIAKCALDEVCTA